MFDGKKIKRGADVDLLGLEEPPLKERQEILASDEEIIVNALQEVKYFNEQFEAKNTVLPEMKTKLLEKLLKVFKVVSRRIMELRKLKVKKANILERNKEKIKKDPAIAKSLSTATDYCKTDIYRIENCVEILMTAQWEICKCGAFLNNTLHLFAEGSVLTERNYPASNSVMLPDISYYQMKYGKGHEIPTSQVKQRSEQWYTARKNVKVTGSSVYAAIGCDTLKAQKEHFDKAIGKIERTSTTKEQQRAMDHGTTSEQHEIATLTSIILPFLFPDLIYHEEGYYVEDGVIVSPDGSIRDKNGSVVFAFEGKAPVGCNFATKQHYKVPERYITQTLFEDKVLRAKNGTLYMCWTEESSTLFLVPKDEIITDTSTRLINQIYHCDTPIRPTRKSEESQQRKQKLKEHAEKCEFIGEFPSVKVQITEMKQNDESRKTNDNKTEVKQAKKVDTVDSRRTTCDAKFKKKEECDETSDDRQTSLDHRKDAAIGESQAGQWNICTQRDTEIDRKKK